MRELTTSIKGVKLVSPNPDRDAQLAVDWLEGERGRQTLLLMGNTDASIAPTSLEAEHKRVQEFLDKARVGSQWTWTIQRDKKTIGAVWISFESTEYLPAPSVHIMIGDPNERGAGIGTATISAVLEYLAVETDAATVYSRYLTNNIGSLKLQRGLGFQDEGENYRDSDGLAFQNTSLDLG